jgi:PilZ domain
MTTGTERRAFARHSPANNDVRVWIADGRAPRITRARLVNISLSGALIETRELLATDRLLRVGLEHAPKVGWVDAKVIRRDDAHRVGVRFMFFPAEPRFIAAATSSAKLWRYDDPTQIDDRSSPFESPSDMNDDGIWVTLTGWNRTSRA